MLKKCDKGCGHLANNGSHPADGCPPPRGIHGEHRRSAKKRKRLQSNIEHTVRGMTVAGTGRPKGGQ